MLAKLKNSERFQREFNQYKKEIDSISNTDLKEKAISLLNKLKEQCILIDEGHNSRNNGYIDPRSLRDNIVNQVNVRKELNQLLKDAKF